jgi:UPF0716 protein FxsA
MGKFLLLFILVPAVELALLIQVGKVIGTPATFGLILLTGFVGAALARAQGVSTLRRLQSELAQGRPPAAAILDGVLILVAGALLLTPGVLTDAVGFALLVPPVRAGVRKLVWARILQGIKDRTIHVSTSGFGPAGPGAGPYPPGYEPSGPLIEGEFERKS